MAAGKSLRSRTLPGLEMAESEEPAHISPIARERARLRDQARKRGGSSSRATRSQLNFVPDTEEQDEAGKEAASEDAQQPFQTDLEQEAGILSITQLLQKVDWLHTDFGQSVQNALDDLGIDSQVPNAIATEDAPGEDCNKEIGGLTDEEGFSAEEETTDDATDAEEDSQSDTSAEEYSNETLNEGTAALLGPETQASAARVDTQAPIIDLSNDCEHPPLEEPNMTDVTASPEVEATAGANPRAPRQFIPRPHVLALVSYYERHFAVYKESIKPKLPSQLVPAKVWKAVFADFKRDHPHTTFKEESLKDPLRIQLRELSKAKEQSALLEEGKDPEQDEELLERLMATDSFRAKGVLQERLNVADRVLGDGNSKKRKASMDRTEPALARTVRPASSNSCQTSSAKSVGKVTKSQNLKDAKDGISSMLQVMTSMNEEKKQENLRKVVLNEGKVALHDAKRRESEERASTLIAQRTAIGEAAKLSRINLLKEQKILGIIDEGQFMEACKVIFYS